ncbi:MAG: hypothetical protein WC554_12970 [Clostridia bacterium]|jgi:hypothetical protein
MAYFKINPIQYDKYTDMGMINVSADFYLNSGDAEYDLYLQQHYIFTPVIPKEGYPRQKEIEEAEYQWSNTIDYIVMSGCIISKDSKEDFYKEYSEYITFINEIKLYNEWRNALPHIWELNSFCNHAIQFEPDVSEEEILWCFEWALALAHQNYILNDLDCKWEGRLINQPYGYASRRAFFEGMKLIPKEKQSEYMQAEMLKVDKASARLPQIQDVDFTKAETIGEYRIK